jgi:hypothetical protein
MRLLWLDGQQVVTADSHACGRGTMAQPTEWRGNTHSRNQIKGDSSRSVWRAEKTPLDNQRQLLATVEASMHPRVKEEQS